MSGTPFNLLRISPRDDCNLRCPACQGNALPFGHGNRALTNDNLLPFIYNNFNPNDWMIEITGGEPTLYPDIKKLLLSLNNKGYSGLVRSNGFKPLPKIDNFVRCITWHQQIPFNKPPRAADHMVILKNPKDNFMAKVNYCKRVKMEYSLLPYLTEHAPECRGIQRRVKDSTAEYINALSTVYATGEVKGCDYDVFSTPTMITEGVIKKNSCRKTCLQAYCFLSAMRMCKKGQDLLMKKYHRL